MSDEKRLDIDWSICARAFESMYEATKELPTQVLMIQCIGILAIFRNQFVDPAPENLDKFNKFVISSLDNILSNMLQNQPEPGCTPIASE